MFVTPGVLAPPPTGNPGFAPAYGDFKGNWPLRFPILGLFKKVTHFTLERFILGSTENKTYYYYYVKSQ